MGFFVDKMMRILVVDDSMIVRTLLTNSLKQVGFENITESDDGYDAFMKIQDAFSEGKTFEIVFIDWNMPMMKGIDVIKKCKANEDLQNIRFIMVSAEQDLANIMAALEAGASDYVTKPFSHEQIEKKLNRILGLRKVQKTA